MNRPLETIFDLLEATANRHPDRTFLDGETPLSYAKAHGRACRMAQRLSRLVPPANSADVCVIGIFAEKCADVTLLPFSVTALGHIFVNINENYTTKYLEHVVRDTGMQLLLYSAEKQPVLDQAQISLSCLGLEDFVDGLEHEAVSKGGFSTVRKIEKAPSTIFYTSGTTGMPKGIVIPHHSLLDGSEVVSSFLGMDSKDRVLSFLPFSFDYGFNQILTSGRVGSARRCSCTNTCCRTGF